VKEGFMNRWQAFIANAQSPELMQPGDSAFDYPPGFANNEKCQSA
jgi:hypothetical protein